MADVYPTPLALSESAAEALGGTTPTPTKIAFVAKGVTPNSSPSLASRIYNEGRHIRDGLDKDKRVTDTAALSVGAWPGDFNVSGTARHFAGNTGTAVTDDATNYVYLTDASTPVFTINTSGFPVDTTTFYPLAIVVAAGGAITSITDQRWRIRDANQSATAATGTTSTVFTLDSDNAGAGADQQVAFNRGTTAADAQIEWDETNDRFNFESEASGPTLADVNLLSVLVSGTTALDSNGAAKVAAAVAGDGLGHSSGVLSVTVDDSTIEIDSDTLRLKDAGITTGKLGNTLADKFAQVSIPDASGATPQSCAITILDIQGNALAETVYLVVGVYQDADGAAEATNATISVTSGTEIDDIGTTANKVLFCKTTSGGALTIAVANGTAESVYVLARPHTRSKILDCSDTGTVTVS